VCKKWIKNSQPFRKKFQKTAGGIFFDSHCTLAARRQTSKNARSLLVLRALQRQRRAVNDILAILER